ncbi:hypothetical protein Hanom_Chr10g00935511 [Helianthus anomalus]
MIKRTKDLNEMTLTELIATIKSCEIDNHKNSLMAAGMTSPNNAALKSQGHPNLVFSPVHGVMNNNPNIVFSPVAAPKSNYVYGMSLPSSQAATVNTTSVQQQPQPQPQHANVAFGSTAQPASQSAPSTPSMEHMAFLTKQNEENRALAASMITSLNAFLANDLMPSSEITPEINQVVEEDLDELDVAWNLGMSAFKAEKFTKKDCKRAPLGYEATQAAAARNKERSMVPVTPAETSTGQGNSGDGRALIVQEQRGFN